jgi:hypothetical protein
MREEKTSTTKVFEKFWEDEGKKYGKVPGGSQISTRAE